MRRCFVVVRCDEKIYFVSEWFAIVSNGGNENNDDETGFAHSYQ